MVKVSVIVPVYNVEKYLEECLDSILAQTLQEIEVICVNDGSTDTSADILDRYAKTDSRIKVVHKANTGYGDTMNTGLDRAIGEYIGIVESDDFIELEMYEELYALAVSNDLDFAKGNYWTYTTDEGKILNTLLPELCECNKVFSRYENMKKINAPKAIWAGIYKKEFLDKHNIRFLKSPGASYQDTSFWHKVAMTAERGYFTDKPYHNYRRDNMNASVKSKGKVYCLCEELKESLKYLEKEELSKEKIYPYLVSDKITVYIWNMQRIADEFKREFICYMSEELNRDDSEGYVKAELILSWRYNIITQVMKYPLGYYMHTYRKDLKYNLENKENIESYFKINPDIYIYGAGKIGNYLKKYLTENFHADISFVVTQKMQEDLDVMSIEFDKLDLHRPVVIAVRGWENRLEMCEQALRRGFEKVYVLEDDMIHYIKDI